MNIELLFIQNAICFNQLQFWSMDRKRELFGKSNLIVTVLRRKILRVFKIKEYAKWVIVVPIQLKEYALC